MPFKALTIEDLRLEGKTVFLRVDINTPVDPVTGRLMELSRIEEASATIRDLHAAKVVVASHQGRVGKYDYISMSQHAKALRRILGRGIRHVEDVTGPAARKEISSLNGGDVLLLDNLRVVAEENFEFTPEDAVRTTIVQRLYRYFDACVLDAFQTAHRAHPSIVGFSSLLPTCGGRLVIKEVKALSRIMASAKAPHTVVLGGAKIPDRLDAVDTLIESGRADRVLPCGLIANVFLRAAKRIRHPLAIDGEERLVEKATNLLTNYPDAFELPPDVAIERDGDRAEMNVPALKQGDKVLDIGTQTIERYSKIVRNSGTVFMSGPPGLFERSSFSLGTKALLKAMASCSGTTIVSGAHTTAALRRYRLEGHVGHISTAGAALVLYLAGKSLPLLEALERAARRLHK